MEVFKPGRVVYIDGQVDVKYSIESVRISRVGLTYEVSYWVCGEKKTQYVAPEEIVSGKEKITIGFKA